MSLKSYLASIWAKKEFQFIENNAKNALQHQEKWMLDLIIQAKNTVYGKENQFASIKDYSSFVQHIAINDYEGIKPYIERIKNGETNVLWNINPKYFAKSSGTTSGLKYIPISNDSINNHIHTARYALSSYIAHSKRSQWVTGNMIFLSGSPTLQNVNGIPTGRLSGIVNHHIPSYLRSNQLPSFATNCIEDWNKKIDRIVDETILKNLTLISGIPPWMIMYFELLLERSGKKTILDIFPNLELIVYGGVNFEPYRAHLQKLLGDNVASIETYPASEGFIAFECKGISTDNALLLNTNSGIFYEFIPLNEIDKPNPKRVYLADVELHKQYALIINSNAGLWGYSIGDTIKFVSKDPYLIKVTGRVQHFISAFGEHVIAEEVDKAIAFAISETKAIVSEYHVSPMVNPNEGLPHHEWLVAFDTPPTDIDLFAKSIDIKLQELNLYYKDLITGNILQPAKVVSLPKTIFQKYMENEGKLGGQNKLPRLKNDRSISNAILAIHTIKN